MNNMAVVAPDLRVPCSQCGGLVHPIAGRCKHCKANLAADRSARPAAVAALPALSHAPVGATPVPLATTAPPIVVTSAAALPVTVISIAPTPAREAYNPMPDGTILPPRPTGRMRAHDPNQRGWLARNWPVFVIILASIAIILAVVLMVLPKEEVADAGVKNGALAPAPERTDTNPLPPSQPAPPTDPSDPWTNPGGGVQPQVPQPQTPDPDPDTTQIDPNDPFKDPFGTGTLGGLHNGGSVGLALMTNIANRLCEKAKSCSDPTIAAMCSNMAALPVTPIPQSCPQAKRCLEVIEQIDVCDGNITSNGLGGPNFPALMMKTSDCLDALSSC